MVVEQKTSCSKPISRIEAPNPANEDEISSTNHSNNDVKFVDQGCQTEKSAVNNGHSTKQTSQQQQQQHQIVDENPHSKGRFLKECQVSKSAVHFDGYDGIFELILVIIIFKFSLTLSSKHFLD